jgi:hypothetical protein
MEEYSAAAPSHTGPRIVVDLDDDVVEAVVPAQSVAWFIGRPPEGMVIAAVCRVLAPSIVGPDPPDREQCPREGQAVGPPPKPDWMKPARGCPAVALALGRPDPGAAERNPQYFGTSEQPTLRSPTWPRDDADEAKRSPSHTVIAPIPNRRLLLYLPAHNR